MKVVMATRRSTLRVVFLTLLAWAAGENLYAQETTRVQWLTFEQLEDSLRANPRKVFVDFYADWCTYCRKMDRVAFKDKAVVELLNKEYYAVKMNIESRDTIDFGGTRFVNQNAKKVNPVHQIPLLMASREGKPFSLPAMVILDEKFRAKARYFQYLDARQMEEALRRTY